MPTSEAGDLTANWDRAIFIDEPLTDSLVRRLTPSILKYRQESANPITVGIDSPGGSLAALDTLLGLLTGPAQNRNRGNIVTVTTNRAYSAAANLLAFGDYSVALSHSKILCHDVRYSEVENVTPSKAMDIAKSLQATNDRFALRLANEIIQRLIWVFIDVEEKVPEVTSKWPKKLAKYRSYLGAAANPITDVHFVDIASFATVLYAKLSPENDALIDSVMERLGKWVILSNLAKASPTFREKGSRIPGLLDGAKHLHKALSYNSESLDASENDLKLFFTLLVAELNEKNKKFRTNLDEATRNFFLIESMSDEKHRHSAMRLMLRNEVIFFGQSVKDLEDEERSKLVASALPYAQLFWLFCVSLCRELFEGEHVLTPRDAQMLGLVDEIAGGGEIESRREWRVKNAAASTS